LSFNYPRDVHFRCLKCASCCGDTKAHVRHILLLKLEAERIAEVTSKTIEEFARKAEGHAPYAYEMRKTKEEEKCVFLENKRCTIYPLRPLICRFYPFELKITKNGKCYFLYTKECQGIGKGKKLTKEYFKDLLHQLKNQTSKRERF